MDAIAELTPLQWLFLAGLGIAGMVLNSLWAHRDSVADWWRRTFPARTVSTVSHGPLSRYVEQERVVVTRSPAFALEPEREREREPAPNAPNAAPAPRGTLYTDEQIARMKRAAEDAGKAEALGLVLGWGLLPEDQRTAAMEALYGKRGERWQRARPLIDEAQARHAPAEEPARLVAINDGRSGYVEI